MTLTMWCGDLDAQLSPKACIDSWRVESGFTIEAFAAEPDVVNPIAMAFDARGRLWVVNSVEYPIGAALGEPGRDTIRIYEDTDRDGRADKVVTFADGLNIPTGIALGHGGVYVGQRRDLWFLQDTDGDDRADVRRRVLSGFGVEDSHHMIHAFTWHVDGWLHFNQGMYINSFVETANGVVALKGGGWFRFHPLTQRLEVFSRGMVNGWGMCIDDDGNAFYVDNYAKQSIKFAVPGATYMNYDLGGRTDVMDGIGGDRNFSGVVVYDGDAFPAEFQGDLFACDFRAHQILRYKLNRDCGATFSANETKAFAVSTDMWTRPIAITVGPDGALYVLDWYNEIINHGEVPFDDPRRDKRHGRIWRIAHKDAPNSPTIDLAALPTAQLVEQLGSDNQWRRELSLRVLAERDAQEVRGALDQFEPPSQSSRANLGKLWAYETIGHRAFDYAIQLSKDESPLVQAQAARAIGQWCSEAPVDDENILNAMNALARQADGLVRLQVSRWAAKCEQKQIQAAAREAIMQSRGCRDDLFRQSVSLTLSELGVDSETQGDPAARVEELLRFSAPPAVSTLSKLLEKGVVPQGKWEQVVRHIGRHGDAAAVQRVADQLERDAPHRRIHLRVILFALADAADRGVRIKPFSPKVVEIVRGGGESADGEMTTAAVKLMRHYYVDAFENVLYGVALNGASPVDARVAALASVKGTDTPQFAAMLASLVNPAGNPAVRIAALSKLAEIDLPEAGNAAAEWLTHEIEGPQVVAALDVFLTRRGGAQMLGLALEDKTLSSDVARAMKSRLVSFPFPTPELTGVIADALGEDAGEMATAQIHEVIEQAHKQGDPRRGERIFFRRGGMSCIGCHRIHNLGADVGPELTVLGASNPIDYIAESVILPSKAIKDEFRTWVVMTDDNRMYTGIRAGETDDHLTLKLTDGTLERISRDVIADDFEQSTSLMPPGIAGTMDPAELSDLIAFLSQLGKPDGPYPADPLPANVAHVWYALGPFAKTADMPERLLTQRSPNLETAYIENGSTHYFTRIHSLTTGELDLSELSPMDAAAEHKVYLLTFAQSDATGAVNLAGVLPGPTRLWCQRIPMSAIDFDQDEPQSVRRFVTEVDKGVNALLFEVTLRAGQPAIMSLEAVGKNSLAFVDGVK